MLKFSRRIWVNRARGGGISRPLLATEGALRTLSDISHAVPDSSAPALLKEGPLGNKLPISPVMKPKFNERRDQLKAPKLRPSPEHLTELGAKLKNNEFAQTLASPIRTCTPTQVRLPTALMIGFTTRLHPDTMSPWVLPAGIKRVDRRPLGRTHPTKKQDQSQVPTKLTPAHVFLSKALVNTMGSRAACRRVGLNSWERLMVVAGTNKMFDVAETTWRKDMPDFLTDMLRQRVVDEFKVLDDLSKGYKMSYPTPLSDVRFESNQVVALRFAGWKDEAASSAAPLAELVYGQRKHEEDKRPVIVYNLPRFLGQDYLSKIRYSLEEVVALKQRRGTVELRSWLWKLYLYMMK